MLGIRVALGVLATSVAFTTATMSLPSESLGDSLLPKANVGIESEPARARKCSGRREIGDVCQGNFLSIRHSFHNCERKVHGKCCALYRNGSGGLDVKKRPQGEDCGFCFGGKCELE
ncbi:uncharacterized protein GGS22DRAFT_144179 [Annulohypoxylon maeteangense]|uniref:uncharacterized protein n=1 Tax=Annulohypoxylon maeteangense TaxID=1927788 RepID=UPI002007D166|nr:uncharacterized protein GGS22DRAFT_144179 [Annulohypoxylon maeteangense]KAI0884569.1 hypothetical protein GGS22DRAFT_144179 [Annulohypoxylon maeteangense]